MKNIFLLLALVIPIITLAQTKKKPIVRKTATTTKAIVKSDEEITIEKAQVWFKDNYVEANFKDPYSFRVVGIKAIATTHKESLNKMLAKIKKRMDACPVPEKDRTEESLKECKAEAEKCHIEMEVYKNSTTSTDRKRYSINAEYYKKFLKIAEAIELYLLDEKEYKRILSKKMSMDPDEWDKMAYYEIHLDCYSKNDLGNEVLGRFVFPFTKDGPVVDTKTTLSMLEKVN